MYISVVKVETPKYETVPKSDNVSIATKLRPMKIPGLAQGKIILKNLWYELKPKLYQSRVFYQMCQSTMKTRLKLK